MGSLNVWVEVNVVPKEILAEIARETMKIDDGHTRLLHHVIGDPVVGVAIGSKTMKGDAFVVVHGFVAGRGADPDQFWWHSFDGLYDRLQVGPVLVNWNLSGSAGGVCLDVV